MQLLTIGNPKTAKGEKRGYYTAILHFAPHKLSGRNVCAHASPECIAACLNTAGRGGIGLDSDGLNVIQRARVRRTQFFTNDRAGFMAQLADEIAAHELRAIRHGLKCAVRLNGTSDIPWENVKCGAFANIFEMFPTVTFYDYTKFPERLRAKVRNIPNYSLTMSYSGHNASHCVEALNAGMNVAAVFSTRKGQPLPESASIVADRPFVARVIDGDETDLRFLDPEGVIVGLRAKGRAKKADASNPFILPGGWPTDPIHSSSHS
jgi:hypothetical protein